MNNFPAELLHNIFIRVPLKQRLECTLVCRYWYNSLSQRSLLYYIDIRSNKKFHNFVAMLKHHPHRGSQVEILKLSISQKIDKRILCYLLPNLRVFEYVNFPFETRMQLSPPVKSEPLNSKLERIKDNARCEVTRQCLMYGLCTRLRHLELNLLFISDPQSKLFKYLKNAPFMTDLTLRLCNLGIQEFELLHENTPSLKRLQLGCIVLIAGQLPAKIIPANTVTQFDMEIEEVRSYPNYLDWYKYMANKYTNLTRFRCDDPELLYAEPTQVIEVYQDAILPLYYNNRTHLHYLVATNIPLELNLFNTMDERGLLLSTLKLKRNGSRPLFEQLAGSNQSKCIESIDFQNTAIGSPALLQQFTALTHISIGGYKSYLEGSVNLTDYLNAVPPTLTSLHARFWDAIVHPLPSHSNNIQHLSLSCHTLYPKLGDAISDYFPKLNQLYLRGWVNEDLRLSLPNHQCEKIHIVAYCKGDTSHGFVITNRDGIQYYMKRHGYGQLEAVAAGDVEGRVKIGIEYGSVNDICYETFPNRD